MKKQCATAGAVLCAALASGAAWAESTTASGTAYAQACQDRGVPLPPAWGSSGWTFSGSLEQNQLYIITDRRAHVYYANTPQGICMALPRGETNQTIDMAKFGVICQGKPLTAGGRAKVCFWDNAQPVAPNTTIVIASTTQNSPSWIGGAALASHPGGTCTDCHAGENPFIVHPGTPLDLGAIQDSGSWPDPLVSGGWVQNPGPGNIPAPGNPALGSGDGDCLQCHGGSAIGRFPELSQLPSFCRSVLRTAYDRSQTAPPSGMPPFDPHPLTYFKHYNAMFNACGLPTVADPGPPSIRDALPAALIAAVRFPVML